MRSAVISGSGLFTPELAISNDELVEAFNRHVELYNAEHEQAIAAGEIEAKEPSSSEFIEKASGIKSRYVMDKDGIVDPKRMYPKYETSDDGDQETPSLMARMGLEAAHEALGQAGLEGEDIDLVICAATGMQRSYPAIAIEIQHHLGAGGYGFDMQVACSSATFGIGTAIDSITKGGATRALVVSPEITSAHLDFKDRDSHFIFGDVCTAVIIEAEYISSAAERWRVLSQKMFTQFSSNIRTNYGLLARHQDRDPLAHEMWFMQEGRKVFKELLPLVCSHISDHLGEHQLAAGDMARMWLHQANINMNQFAARKLLGRDASADEAPIVLDDYANTASAGSIIAFHKHRDGLVEGDKGIICSFGAGYSVGSLIIERI